MFLLSWLQTIIFDAGVLCLTTTHYLFMISCTKTNIAMQYQFFHRPINLSLSQFLKDGCIGERQMAFLCKKHKRPEGQQMAHILTLNMF